MPANKVQTQEEAEKEMVDIPNDGDPVDIDLVWLQIPETSLAVVLITTFFVGVFTGSILVLIASMLPKQRNSVDA